MNTVTALAGPLHQVERHLVDHQVAKDTSTILRLC